VTLGPVRRLSLQHGGQWGDPTVWRASARCHVAEQKNPESV